MKLLDYFKSFLENEVNLNESRLALLNQRVGAITTFLKGSETFKDRFVDVIPQGSYAHKTIIRPVCENDGFDADILLELSEFEDWEPKNYVQELYTAFRKSDTYKEMVSRKTRCVVVKYAGDFHVDVVPFLERHGEKYITNRHENAFELTDPEGYNEWLDEKDRITGRHLVRVIRLVKYLRDFKNTFSVKSIILNALLAGQVSEYALLVDGKCYADVPTTLRTLMNALSAYVKVRPLLPTIEDPAGTGEYLSDRWDQEGYANFRTWIMHYAEKINDAWEEEGRDESLRKWQVVFGDDFKKPEPKEAAKGSLVVANESAASKALIRFDNTEQHLDDFGIRVDLVARFSVRIMGVVQEEKGWRSYILARSGNNVDRYRRIRFSIKVCTVPHPYEIYWKVRNVGPEAEAANKIRGQIVKGDRVWYRLEPTKFRGPHYVECYIVKDGVCVAMDHQPVNIT